MEEGSVGTTKKSKSSAKSNQIRGEKFVKLMVNSGERRKIVKTLTKAEVQHRQIVSAKCNAPRKSAWPETEQSQKTSTEALGTSTLVEEVPRRPHARLHSSRRSTEAVRLSPLIEKVHGGRRGEGEWKHRPKPEIIALGLHIRSPQEAQSTKPGITNGRWQTKTLQGLTRSRFESPLP